MKNIKIKKICLIITAFVFLTGCSLKSQKEKEILENCDNKDLVSLLKHNGKLKYIYDERTQEEKQKQNEIFTPYECCKLKNASMEQILAIYGEKTGYKNEIEIVEGSLTSLTNPAKIIRIKK